MTAAELFHGHPGHHCRPPSRLALFFRRAIAAVRRKAAPEVPSASSGAAEAPISAPAFRPDQLLGARFDTPDQTGKVIGFEAEDDAFYDKKAGWGDLAEGRHARTDPVGFPVLDDRTLAEVCAEHGEPYAPAPWRPVPTFTSTPQAAHAQAMHDLSARYLPAPETIGGYPVTYHRPRGPRGQHPYPPRRRVYGQAPQLEVERDMARAAGERARQRYEPASADLLRQVLDGLVKL